ncbi:MAG TPA: hypothetical protein PL182_04535 [Pseudobdellovibrionaceae bacterium]|nr:hypothetical protein [Pseudobdellovibrionaceae bacterium]
MKPKSAAAPQAQKSPVARKATSTPVATPAKSHPAPVTAPRPQVSPAAQKPRHEALAMKLLILQRKEPVLDPQQLVQASEDIKEEGRQATAEEPEKLLGILALCAIRGHDVHFLNHELEIDQHVPESTPLEGRLQEARLILKRKNDSLVAVLVFENHFQYLHKNGEVSEDV